MGAILRPNKSDETSIILQTRMRNDIPNSQSHEISPSEANQFRDCEKTHPYAKFRPPPNPIYNCHGLVFASRRTGIDRSDILCTVLDDDGYTEIVRDEVLPGDIILYYNEDGDIEHSGIVITKPDDMQLRIPQVVSKWGRYKEVVHSANDCPYSFANVRYFRVTK